MFKQTKTSLMIVLLLFGLLTIVYAQEATPVISPDEFIKVAPDSWSFCGAKSGASFVPLGTNFVLQEKRLLDNFSPDVYDQDKYAQILDAMQDIGINIVKVFLPIATVLPDPQGPDTATITPGFMDNLEEFLGMCRERNIRVVISLACWGGNGIKWWHEGGEYWGRKPWKMDNGVDSITVLNDFWRQICTRFANDPTIFAWTPTIEWSMPAGNLTWVPPGKQQKMESEQGRFFWQEFLKMQYEADIDALNTAFNSSYADFAEIEPVDYEYNEAQRKYGSPDAMILAYQDFKEWTCMRYLKPQIEAIKLNAPNHMVTISNHMRRPNGLWPGAAQYFMGFSEPEQTDLVDYLTTHDNHSESELRPDQKISDVVRGSILRARFCNARAIKPLIIEELTFAANTPEFMADSQEQMVRGTVGHASGWMNWYLQYPVDPNEADSPEKSAILDENLQPTVWGLRLKQIVTDFKTADLSRIPAQTVITCDRNKDLVPHELGSEHVIVRDWDSYAQPVDFIWPENRWINEKLPTDPEESNP